LSRFADRLRRRVAGERRVDRLGAIALTGIEERLREAGARRKVVG